MNSNLLIDTGLIVTGKKIKKEISSITSTAIL